MLSADAVTGPYDIIAHAEAVTLNALDRMVTSQVQMIDGITRTLTSTVFYARMSHSAFSLELALAPPRNGDEEQDGDAEEQEADGKGCYLDGVVVD